MDALGLGDLRMVLPSSAIFFPLMVMDIMICPYPRMVACGSLARPVFPRQPIMVVVSGEMLHG